MQGVGFEPTHANIADLKSAPLDHSGNLARNHYHIFLKKMNMIYAILYLIVAANDIIVVFAVR